MGALSRCCVELSKMRTWFHIQNVAFINRKKFRFYKIILWYLVTLSHLAWDFWFVWRLRRLFRRQLTHNPSWFWLKVYRILTADQSIRLSGWQKLFESCVSFFYFSVSIAVLPSNPLDQRRKVSHHRQLGIYLVIFKNSFFTYLWPAKHLADEAPL